MHRTRTEDAQKRQEAMVKFRKFALYYTLVSVPVCLLIMFWPMADNVSIHGKAAHYLAIPLAFILGLVFISILFFSSNSGGDEQPNYVEMAERQDRKKKEAAQKDAS
jgi:hypothetical protein